MSKIFEIIGMIVIYGGGAIITICFLFFAVLGFMFFTSYFQK